MDSWLHKGMGWRYPLLIIIWGTLTYANSFYGVFQLDDHHFILNNNEIKRFENFGNSKRWTKVFFNRQLPRLSVAVNYWLHGYDLFGYHLTNLVIHLLAGLCVFGLLRLLYTCSQAAGLVPDQRGPPLALAGALLFVSHPVQTQAVTYLTQRLASMAALFYLAALYCYIRGRMIHSSNNNETQAAWWYGGVALCFVLGVLSKATILSLPLALLLVEVCFVRDLHGRLYRRYIGVSSGVLLILGTLVLFHKWSFQMREAPSRLVYLMTQFKVLVTYIKLLCLPYPQQAIYDFPASQGLWEGQTLAGFVLLACLVGAAVLAFRRYRLLTFGVGFFFIALSVESSIMPLKYVIFEYRLYLPVFGYALLVPVLVQHGLGAAGRPALMPRRPGVGSDALVWPTLGLIIVACSCLTFQQNRLWQDPIALWSENIKRAPNGPEPYHHLGYHYFMIKDYPRSKAFLDRAIALKPDYYSAYNQRGLTVQMLGNHKQAIEDLTRAIEIRPGWIQSTNNRASLYQLTGEYEKARDDYQKVVENLPKYGKAFRHLGYVYFMLGQYEEARVATDKAFELGEEDTKLYIQRGNIAINQGRVQAAIDAFTRALERSPNDKGAHNNLGIAYQRQGRLKKAIKQFDRALALDSNFADALFNRAVVFTQMGDRTLALADLAACLRINPKHASARAAWDQLAKARAPAGAAQKPE